MISNDAIRCDLEFYKDILSKCKNRLKKLPPGHIVYINQHGKPRPHHSVNGKVTYLSRKKRTLILQLLQKSEIERAMEYSQHNVDCLEMIESKLFDPIDTIPAHLDLPIKRNVPIIIAELESRISGTPNYKGKHITSTGITVKSKSELILYEFLKSKGIQFYYEKGFYATDRWLVPDFTLIRRKDGKIFLWEHFGMMSIKSYADRTLVKLHEYALSGFWPNDNLILTYESDEGMIDLTEVERILKRYEFI